MTRRATYVVDGGFFGHFSWKVEGTVRKHVSHIQLPYTAINMWRINVWRGHSHAATVHMWMSHLSETVTP